MTTRWTIAIAWNRDGACTDETARVLSARWTLGFQQAFMNVADEDTLTLTMRNGDQRFTP